MAYLLRTLVLLMILSILLTTLVAKGLVTLPLGHILIAIPTFLYCIFAQAFIMFFFVGVNRFVENVHGVLSSGTKLEELFETPPADLTPYLKSMNKFVYDAKLFKRQTVPWSALMLVLGMIAFFLGGAHDTGLVSKEIHSGVVYGFIMAAGIGSVRQWIYLGRAHKLLRQLKGTFSLEDAAM